MSRFAFILLLVGMFVIGGCQKSEQETPPAEQQEQEQVDTTSMDTAGTASMPQEEQEAAPMEQEEQETTGN